MDSAVKSVLFISPAFFGYETAIKNAIIENGYDVDYFDERTSNNSFLKAIFRVKKELLTIAINKYYRKIFDQIKNKPYAWFLLIKGEVVPEWFINDFKRANPGAKLIYYTYDSFNNNNEHSIYILKHFNVCYSFDFEDVKANPSLKLKHLFYAPEFANKNIPEQKRPWQISFVGTLHSNRYQIIKSIFSRFNDTFIFYYLPARWWFLIEKLTKKQYKSISWSEVSFDKLSGKQVADIFKSSQSVLDIQRFGQTGLTMRTFEVLAAGAILITTNPYIKLADFYDEEKIIVLDDLNLVDENEVKRRISAVRPESNFNNRLEKYAVNNWVKEFFV